MKNPESFSINNHPKQEHERKRSIHFEVLPDKEAVAEYGAQAIIETISAANEDESKDHAVLLLPTGKTPKLMYEVLAKQIREAKIDLHKVVIARVEGFANAEEGDKRSFDQYMVDRFFEPIGLEATEENFLRIENLVNANELESLDEEGRMSLLKKAGEAYDEKIRELGGVDLAILGLGGDAHIGDVQPSDIGEGKLKQMLGMRHTRPLSIKHDFDPYTQDVFAEEYADQDGNLPSNYFMTVGMSPIHRAKHVIVMATGESKSDAVHRGYKEANEAWENNRQATPSPFGFMASITPDEKTKFEVVTDKEAAQTVKKQLSE